LGPTASQVVLNTLPSHRSDARGAVAASPAVEEPFRPAPPNGSGCHIGKLSGRNFPKYFSIVTKYFAYRLQEQCGYNLIRQ